MAETTYYASTIVCSLPLFYQPLLDFLLFMWHREDGRLDESFLSYRGGTIRKRLCDTTLLHQTNFIPRVSE